MIRKLKRNEIIETMPPPQNGQAYFVVDNVVANLFIKVGKRSKIFLMIARFGGNENPTRRTIGRHPLMSLEEAREIAVKWSQLNAAKLDPHIERQRVEEKEELANRSTFRNALEDYINWLPDRPRNRKVPQEQAHLRNEFLNESRNPFIDKKVSEVTGKDIQLIIEAIRDRGAPSQAFSMLGLIRTFFNWLLTPSRSDQYGIEISPCDRLKASQLGLQRNKRKRSHTTMEIRAYWAATVETPSPWQDFFRAVLLTGQRKSDVALAVWSEINFKRGIWTIPEERYKTGRDQTVPLSVPMQQMLERIRSHRCELDGPYIFSSTDGRKPISGFSKATKSFRCLMAEKFSEMYPEDPIPKHWVIHDNRRTTRTGLSILGVPTEVAEAVIGHEKKELEKVYNTNQFRHQRRQALHLWAEEIKLILDDPNYDPEDESGLDVMWQSRWNDTMRRSEDK